MINGKKGVMKSSTRDILLFQIMEDVANMEKENCTPKLFKDADEKVNMTDVSVKLKKLFGITDDIDVDTEYELIKNQKSKLSSMKRTVIKFLALAKKNYVEKEIKDDKPASGETLTAQHIDECPFCPVSDVDIIEDQKEMLSDIPGEVIDAEVVS